MATNVMKIIDNTTGTIYDTGFIGDLTRGTSPVKTEAKYSGGRVGIATSSNTGECNYSISLDAASPLAVIMEGDIDRNQPLFYHKLLGHQWDIYTEETTSNEGKVTTTLVEKVDMIVVTEIENEDTTADGNSSVGIIKFSFSCRMIAKNRQ